MTFEVLERLSQLGFQNLSYAKTTSSQIVIQNPKLILIYASCEDKEDDTKLIHIKLNVAEIFLEII